jgi:hypothetical protein
MSMEVDTLAQDGFIVLRDFYSSGSEIRQIQLAIQRIVSYVCEQHGVEVDSSTPELAMGPAYTALYESNPIAAGQVYDAVKQIPEFVALTSDPRNAELFRLLRPGSDPAIAAGGSGIRIDRPGDSRYRAAWHQEFPAQLRSVDGLVFWSPLMEVTASVGPVVVAKGSHKEGCVPVRRASDSSGAYALRLDDEEAVVGKYEHVAQPTAPGDLVVIDFLTLHRSGSNESDKPRWSMQFRYFNLLEPIGRQIGWTGSFASGQDFSQILPSLLVGE